MFKYFLRRYSAKWRLTMKKVFTMLTTLLLGAILAAPAFAADAAEPLLISPAPEITDTAEVSAPQAYPVIEGFEYAFVKSSMSNASGDISYFFDGTTNTMCGMDMTGLPTRTVSIYMTSYAPYTLSAVAGVFSSSEADLSIQVSVYGANDSMLMDWTQIELDTNIYSLGDYVVFTNTDYAEGAEAAADPAVYQFYRVDLTLLAGNSFTLAELVFFRPEGPLMVPVYDTSDGVDIGEEPIGYVEFGAEKSAEEPVEEEEQYIGTKPFIRKLNPIPTPYSPAKN